MLVITHKNSLRVGENPLQAKNLQIAQKLVEEWGQPGFEPGTTCTRNRYHTPRLLSLHKRDNGKLHWMK